MVGKSMDRDLDGGREMNRQFGAKKLALLLGVAACGLGGQAWAEDAPPAAAQADGDTTGDIVATATRGGDQSTQDIPMSIDA